MLTDPIEDQPVPRELPSGMEDTPAESRDGAAPAHATAVGLAVYTANAAWTTVSTAVRLTSYLAGTIFSPVKRVVDGSALESVGDHFEKLVARGEKEVEEWTQAGLSQETRTFEVAKSVVDPLINGVVSYLSTHPAVQKLVKDQIELLAKESPELPQINILVRVLADNYITYLNENPDQVQQLIQNQADVYIDHLQENPEQVQDLVQGQSASMIAEINDEVRERLVTGDSILEALARRLFRRRPRYELPEPPPEIKARALQARLPGDFPRLEAMRHDE